MTAKVVIPQSLYMLHIISFVLIVCHIKCIEYLKNLLDQYRNIFMLMMEPDFTWNSIMHPELMMKVKSSMMCMLSLKMQKEIITNRCSSQLRIIGINDIRVAGRQPFFLYNRYLRLIPADIGTKSS